MTHKIFVLAGEASGDQLGGAIMKHLKDIEPEVSFEGVGGISMKGQGLESLMPMEELCVMGIWEIIDHLPRLLKLINGMVEEIESRQPDILFTIDLPDFNFRVAQKLKKRGIFKGKIIHCVAPTVWAWRAGRAKKIAGFLDGLMCLFPFEPPYFEKHGLQTVFVGHPLVEKAQDLDPIEDYRALNNISKETPVLAVMFGSRATEFKTHAPIFADAIKLVQEQIPDLEIIAPTLPHLEFEVTELLSDCGVPSSVVLLESKKVSAMRAADVALAVSGTIALELAYARVPHIIGYKTNIFTWMILKLMVKTKYAHLANIILDKPAVPEYLQFACTSENLATGILKLFQDTDAVQAQRDEFSLLYNSLMTKEAMPAEKAAQFIHGYLK